MNASVYREGLPPIPMPMLKLPVDRGYPVPYFAAWLDGDQKPYPRADQDATPDFRVLFPGVVEDCWRNDRCWVCGGVFRSRIRTFLIGPMCAINRTSAEPPGHYECMRWSAIACPFMARPHAKRREVEGTSKEDVPGIMLDRNPGVGLVWTSRTYSMRKMPNGLLFDVGDPMKAEWFAEGREATREEVQHSIDTGLPPLQKMADDEGRGAPEELARRIEAAQPLLPEAA